MIDVDELSQVEPVGVSRPSRFGPRLPAELQQMIARMVHDNPTWGEERIADELWLKLGIRVSPRNAAPSPVEESRGPGLPSPQFF
jgi:hypothetical protein